MGAIRIAVLASVLGLSLLASGCGTPARPVPVDPTSTSVLDAHVALLESDGHPLSTRTGIPDVDSVLAVLERGSLAEISALGGYQSLPCVTEVQEGRSAPRCPHGSLPGDVVEVLPMANCRGVTFAPADLFWAATLRGSNAKLHAVYVNAPARKAALPLGDYAIVITRRNGERVTGAEAQVSKGRVVSVDFSCDTPAQLARTGSGGTYILKPKN